MRPPTQSTMRRDPRSSKDSRKLNEANTHRMTLSPQRTNATAYEGSIYEARFRRPPGNLRIPQSARSSGRAESQSLTQRQDRLADVFAATRSRHQKSRRSRTLARSLSVHRLLSGRRRRGLDHSYSAYRPDAVDRRPRLSSALRVYIDLGNL